jgi:hypothetical protein
VLAQLPASTREVVSSCTQSVGSVSVRLSGAPHAPHIRRWASKTGILTCIGCMGIIIVCPPICCNCRGCRSASPALVTGTSAPCSEMPPKPFVMPNREKSVPCARARMLGEFGCPASQCHVAEHTSPWLCTADGLADGAKGSETDKNRHTDEWGGTFLYRHIMIEVTMIQ